MGSCLVHYSSCLILRWSRGMCTNLRAVSFLQVLIRLREPCCFVAICSLFGETATKLPTQRGRARWFALRWYANNGVEARHLRRRRPCWRGAHVAAHASEARGASALSCRPLHVHRMCMHTACSRHLRALHACATNALWATVARMCTPGNRRARGFCGRCGYGTRHDARRMDQGVLRLGPCGRQRGAVCR